MEDAFQESQRKAVQQYEAAFHLMHATYSLLGDPKLLLGIMHNLEQSFYHGIDAVLEYERQLHLVPPYPNNPQSKLELFRSRCLSRNKIPANLLAVVQEMKELIEMKEKCPVEFQKGTRYVLCSKNYQLKTVSLDEIKVYLAKTKEFIDHVNRILPTSAAPAPAEPVLRRRITNLGGYRRF